MRFFPPGFGRSGRPTFSNDAEKAEYQLVRSVEEWRREMQLEKFVLLGHSMGGFLAASYAIQYPERVKHLILADPWGFPEKPSSDVVKATNNVPLWVKAIAYVVHPLNPFWAVRFAGPFGLWLNFYIFWWFFFSISCLIISVLIDYRTMAYWKNEARHS